MGKFNEFKERINYVVVDSGRYCGSAVNLPLVCEADSLEELERKMKIMGKLHLDMMQETISMEHPFNFVDETEKWEAAKIATLSGTTPSSLNIGVINTDNQGENN